MVNFVYFILRFGPLFLGTETDKESPTLFLFQKKRHSPPSILLGMKDNRKDTLRSLNNKCPSFILLKLNSYTKPFISSPLETNLGEILGFPGPPCPACPALSP